MTTKDRRKLAENLAKGSISRARHGLMIRSSNSATFLGESHGVLCLRVEEEHGTGRLMAVTPTGSTEVARGPVEEMEALCERAWDVMRSDLPSAIALSFGLIGLLVGVLVSGFAMFAMNDQHHPLPMEAAISTPAVLPGPIVIPRLTASVQPSLPEIGRVSAPARAAIIAALSAPNAPTIPTATLTPHPTPAPSTSPVPGTDGKPTLQNMVERLMQSDAARGKQVVDTIESMGNYVRGGQDVPEELVELLPFDILQKMVEDAHDTGVTEIKIRPKGSPALPPPVATQAPPALPPPVLTQAPPAPALQRSAPEPVVPAPEPVVPTAPAPVLPTAPAPVSQVNPVPQRISPMPVVNTPTVPAPVSQVPQRPATIPAAPAPISQVNPSVERPLIWGGPNGEGVPRDKNGVPTVPEADWRAARPGSILLPGLGGGNLNSTTDLRSFSLPTE